MIVAAVSTALIAPAHADTRQLSGFDAVIASGRFHVEIAVAETYSITVEGADAARIRTAVQRGALKIEPSRRPWFGEPRYDALVRVTLPSLTSVSAARGAVVSAAAGGGCGAFDAVAAMGADLTVAGLECVTVSASAAMGAELEMAGTCGSLDLSAAMGAAIDTTALRCRELDASAAMGADVEAFASDSYDASAAMGGDIIVIGGATAGERSASMGGSIRNRD
jgi:hypothetical protein